MSRGWSRGRPSDDELSEELRSHLALAIRDRIARGESPEEARLAALREFGNVPLIRGTARDMWGWRWRDALAQDLRYAVRGLMRSPGLTVTIVLALGLGVGANAAVFSVLDRLYFRQPSGVADPQRVLRIFASSGASVPVFSELQTAAVGLAQIEGYSRWDDRRIGDDSAYVSISYVTTGFFELLGATPARGRFPRLDENRFGNPGQVAVLSDAIWRRQFGSDSGIIGRTIKIGPTAVTVIGVGQPDFGGTDLEPVDLWMPAAAMPRTGSEGPNAWWTDRYSSILDPIARLRPGVSAKTLEALLTLQYHRSNGPVPWIDPHAKVVTGPLLEARGPVHYFHGADANLALAIRLGGVALAVLVIATSNVASLLLMRALRRRREIALRLALGISRRRLVLQLLIESLLLAMLAGVVAIFVTAWTGGLLRAILLHGVRWPVAVVDGRVVSAAMGLALVAGGIAALAPISLALRRDLVHALKSGSAEISRAGSPARVGLLVTQTALSVVLLAGAGTLLQSLHRARTVDVGFASDELISVDWPFAPPGSIAELMPRMARVPSVRSVASTYGTMMNGGFGASFRIPGRDSLSERNAPAVYIVDSGYFKTAGYRMVSGRMLAETDGPGTEPVTVITESLAEAFWPGQNPIGLCFFAHGPPCRRIVGVAHDIRWKATEAPPAAYFLPVTQVPKLAEEPSLLVRTEGPATRATVAALEHLLTPYDADPRAIHAPLRIRRVADTLAPQTERWRVASLLLLIFGALAIASAALGIYGLVAYDVSQRNNEIGVRLALGAEAGAILRLVLRRGVRVVAIGVCVGLALTPVTGRLLSSLLFDTSPVDTAALGGTALAMILIGVLASLIPALRATRVDPVVALRES